MSLLDDHNEFCELVKKQVRYRLKHVPVITCDDWVIRCYFSPYEFGLEFPDIYERETYLSRLRDCRERSSDSQKSLAVIMSQISW